MKVTVLMSVYNGELYVKDAIESILTQTYRDFEFLIIDDGSTDATATIIQSYDDQRVRFIKHQQNHGLSSSLKEGVEEASGEYIARIDADDIALPDRIAEQVEAFEHDKKLGLLGAWYDLNDSRKRSLIEYHRDNDPIMLRWALLFGNVFGHSTIMMRKEACLQAGNYDKSLDTAQDYDLWFRIARHWNIGLIPRVLVRANLSKSSISVRKDRSQRDSVRMISLRNMKECASGHLDELECNAVLAYMTDGELSSDIKEDRVIIQYIITLIDIFVSRMNETISRDKIKYDCIKRMLNSISPEAIIWRKIRTCLIAARLSMWGTVREITSKVNRRLGANESFTYIFSKS
ncbi:MAG: glycosyltransferase [Candidatus Omnitrophica bacterium]|nr:glycosyltransferase [Candidatus Omnitrophota bacterium]